MTTQEIICDLRDQAEVFGPCTIYHLLNTAADELENLDKLVRRWVSVKDRPPEEDGLYNVYCKDGSMTCAWFEDKWFIDHCECGDGYVTHWMQLPALPEDDSHEP